MLYGVNVYGQQPFGSTSAIAEVGLKLLISGVDRSGLLSHETLKLRDPVNGRSSLSFNLVDAAGLYLPQEGEAIMLKVDGRIEFRGSLEDVDWTSGWTSGRFITCKCVNMARALDRRLVARAYVGNTTEEIVADVIDTYLADDGIVAGTISPGPVLTKAVFNYMKASKVLDELCDMTGYSWMVDQYGQLHMRDRSTVTAPWNITDASAPVLEMRVRRNRAEYSNTQWLRAGQDETDERTDLFKGDGTRETFTMKFPIATEPTVTVNAVAKTVGIRGIDAGKDWYWNKGDKELTQDDAGTPLTSSDTLSVTYTGFYPLVVKVLDEVEIQARQAIEAGSGIYERIDSDESIEDRELAATKAAGLLRKYGAIPESVAYTTYTHGIRAGMLQTILRSEDAVDGEYLVVDVTMTWSVDRNGWVIRVQTTSGEELGGWRNFFKKLFASGTKFTIRENEVIYNPTPHLDNVHMVDEVNFVDPAGDGAADSLTTAWVSDPTQAVEKQFRVGKARVGRDYHS